MSSVQSTKARILDDVIGCNCILIEENTKSQIAQHIVDEGAVISNDCCNGWSSGIQGDAVGFIGIGVCHFPFIACGVRQPNSQHIPAVLDQFQTVEQFCWNHQVAVLILRNRTFPFTCFGGGWSCASGSRWIYVIVIQGVVQVERRLGTLHVAIIRIHAATGFQGTVRCSNLNEQFLVVPTLILGGIFPIRIGQSVGIDGLGCTIFIALNFWCATVVGIITVFKLNAQLPVLVVCFVGVDGGNPSTFRHGHKAIGFIEEPTCGGSLEGLIGDCRPVGWNIVIKNWVYGVNRCVANSSSGSLVVIIYIGLVLRCFHF